MKNNFKNKFNNKFRSEKEKLKELLGHKFDTSIKSAEIEITKKIDKEFNKKIGLHRDGFMNKYHSDVNKNKVALAKKSDIFIKKTIKDLEFKNNKFLFNEKKRISLDFEKKFSNKMKDIEKNYARKEKELKLKIKEQEVLNIKNKKEILKKQLNESLAKILEN